MENQPNILFVMCDQLRFDAIRALGNAHVYTPNIDRLAKRGVTFTQAYSSCPVCIPARYTIRTGRQSLTTRSFLNATAEPAPSQHPTMEGRCGPYLARTMAHLGYRTFAVGKSHTCPDWNEPLGYEVHLHSEELYANAQQRQEDDFAVFIAREHGEYDFLEGLMGERTEMYYMPQMSAMPAEITVEAWAAEQAIEQLAAEDKRPYFGLVSFIGPHPPCAPPIPFNRMYDPDRMANPIKGDLQIDHMDEQIPWMNHAIWAEDINDAHARVLKARYYGEITYIDQCLGRILDAVQERDDADNTLICFFSDHGDHLGDHHAWQKESFFEASCHVPFLVSWPVRLKRNVSCDELVCLSDLFGIATTAAGAAEVRDGIDVLGMLNGAAAARQNLTGYYGVPGTNLFKVMVRQGDWKYIFMANGGREQLFKVTEDPHELQQRLDDERSVADRLRQVAIEALRVPGGRDALDGDELRSFEFVARAPQRIYQFDASRGVYGFPERPEDILR